MKNMVLENKWMIMTGLLLFVAVIFIGGNILEQMYLNSLDINERIELMKEGNMTLDEKLNLFR